MVDLTKMNTEGGELKREGLRHGKMVSKIIQMYIFTASSTLYPKLAKNITPPPPPSPLPELKTA